MVVLKWFKLGGHEDYDVVFCCCNLIVLLLMCLFLYGLVSAVLLVELSIVLCVRFDTARWKHVCAWSFRLCVVLR